MRFTISTTGPEATAEVGAALGRLAEAGDVLLLCGDLGAGKTQLVKGLARGLGIAEPVTSPTFNILLVHAGGRLALNHIDLYRLEHADRLEDIDYFGTLESGGVSAVEWGDRFPEADPEDRLALTLHIVSDDERRLDVDPRGWRSGGLADSLACVCDGLPGVRVDEVRA
jgi:tRNA threonylcarbamoyladenosine biosynthesis protein TsaE